MPIKDPKAKTISFRLSKQEYVAAEQVREERRFESMSVFARCAVLTYASTSQQTTDEELEAVKQRLDAVVQQVANLTKRFEDS